jgi:hypothetical protein
MENMNPWVCPENGTTIEKDVKYYFLYEAYNKTSHQYTGLEGLLSELFLMKNVGLNLEKRKC